MPGPPSCDHTKFMRLALDQARLGRRLGEVPVGAVIVRKGDVISRAYNRREHLSSPLGHAELIAIHKAAKLLNSWRLTGCELYVTLEPCIMCSGALIQARLDRVIFAAYDPKGGALRSLYRLGEDTRLNHRLEVTDGVLADEASQLLSGFFQKLRKAKVKRP